MKRIFPIIASLAVVLGLVASSQATDTGRLSRTTSSPAPIAHAPHSGKLAALNGKARLSTNELKALGLKRLSGHELVQMKHLIAARKANAARPAEVGTTYWYSWHYYGQVYMDRTYSIYTVNSSYYYVYLYDNFKICTVSGTGCVDAHAYNFYEGVYYYGTWYGYYGPYGPYQG